MGMAKSHRVQQANIQAIVPKNKPLALAHFAPTTISFAKCPNTLSSVHFAISDKSGRDGQSAQFATTG
jgi:hypothetical protein